MTVAVGGRIQPAVLETGPHWPGWDWRGRGIPHPTFTKQAAFTHSTAGTPLPTINQPNNQSIGWSGAIDLAGIAIGSRVDESIGRSPNTVSDHRGWVNETRMN